MGECTRENLNDYFQMKGHKWLIGVTIVEILFYLAYTIIFMVIDDVFRVIHHLQVYRWAFTIVLLTSVIYFLWHSVRINVMMMMIVDQKTNHGT